jgi:hypothetical protein
MAAASWLVWTVRYSGLRKNVALAVVAAVTLGYTRRVGPSSVSSIRMPKLPKPFVGRD